MKYIKTFEKNKKMRFKAGDYVAYDKYVAEPSIIVIITSVRANSQTYFTQNIKPPYDVYLLSEDDVYELTDEQKEEVNLYLKTQKYNL